MSGVVQPAAPPPQPPPRLQGEAGQASPPPPPPPNVQSHTEKPTATKLPSSREEVAKRNMAQDLLAKFMKQAATTSQKSTTQVKRAREEESPGASADPENHFSGVHPSRRQRLMQAKTMDAAPPSVPAHQANPNAQISPAARQINPAARQMNLAAYQMNPAQQQMNPAAYQMNPAAFQMNPAGYGTPPQDPTTAHIFAGAGQLNFGPVALSPEIFCPPPWSGRASQKFFFDVYAGKDKVNRFPIWTEKILVVGRQPDCNIVVHHALVSRRHMIMLFHEDDGQLMVYDLGSTHGSYLNDMSGTIPINDGLLPRKHYIKVRVGWRMMFGKCAYQYALTSDGPNTNWAPPAVEPPPAPKQRQKVEDKQEEDRERERDQLRGAARFLQYSNAVNQVKKEEEDKGWRLQPRRMD